MEDNQAFPVPRYFQPRVPEGRLNVVLARRVGLADGFCSAVHSGLHPFACGSPGVETPGYFHTIPRGRAEATFCGVKWLLLLCLCFGFKSFGTAAPAAESGDESPTVIIAVGAPGEKEYGEKFAAWAQLWQKACLEAGAQQITIGLDETGTSDDLDRLKQTLDQQGPETSRELWLVLIGHGTFDGKEAKFNLRGPDLSTTDLASWLEPIRRPVAVIDTSSCSGPFLKKLSRIGRVVITATRSGYEQNYTRFGQFFSTAISDPKADLDKDGQVSLLEAFIMAANQVTESYKTEGRLATEHALLDDNGDGLGTPPDWFRGVRAVKKPTEGTAPDGLRAHQLHLLRSEAERQLSPALRTQRNELEVTLEQLRQIKSTLPVDEYYQRLETILLDLAHLYEPGQPTQPESPDPQP